MVTLRDYQQEAVEAVFREWNEELRRNTLLAMATGVGKTTVFGEIARRSLYRGVLVLAHRDELVRQAAERLSGMCGTDAEIEKADERYTGSSKLCIGSVQTLQGDRLDAFPAEEFSTVIIDEAHHSVSPSYRAILDAFGHANVLGVTATPDRSDRRALGEVYDSIAYEYGIERAVKEGWLSPIRAKFVPLALDVSEVKVSHGDFQVGDLGNALDPYIPQIARVMATECAGRKTVVFLPLVATADKMAEALNAAGLSAACVSGYDSADERKAKIAAFEAGEVKVLCNSMLLTEGWDCPSVDCIVILRPTRSRALYAQMVGRGTRTADGKDHLLLLDFLWQTERHDLCRPASLFGRAERVGEVIQERIEQSGDPSGEDLLSLADTCEKDVQAEREAALAKQLASMRRRKKKLVDPLQYAVSICDADLTEYEPTFAWQKERPTQKQLDAIERFNVDSEGIATRGMASAILDALVKRADEKLSTAKQIRFLESKGFEHVGTWSFEQASYAIGRISSNSWRVPWDIRPGAIESTSAFLSRAGDAA